MKMKYITIALLCILTNLSLAQNHPYKIDQGYCYIQKKNRENKTWKVVWQDDFNTGKGNTV